MQMPIETARGSPYEMGRQHGRLYRHVIHANVAEWSKRHSFQGSDEAIDAAIKPQRVLQEELCPWVFDELRGIADGSEVDYQWILRMHLRVWNAAPRTDYAAQYGCTAIGMITEDAGVAVGGTLDDPRSSYVLIRRIPKNGLAHVMTTWAGTAWGHNGTNEAGLGLAQASLGGIEGPAPSVSRKGLLQGMYGRIALETCATVAETLALADRFHAGGSDVLGDAGGNLVARQRMGGIQGTMRASDSANMVFCANHIYMTELTSALAECGAKPIVTEYSRGRFETLEQARERMPRTVGTMRTLLRSHSRYPHSICNAGTVNANFSLPCKEPGVLYFADKPVCQNEFTPYPAIPFS